MYSFQTRPLSNSAPMVRGMADHTLWDKEFRLVVDIIFLFFFTSEKGKFQFEKILFFVVSYF